MKSSSKLHIWGSRAKAYHALNMPSCASLPNAHSTKGQHEMGNVRGATRGPTLLCILLFTFLSTSLILSACSGRSYHATPLDALTEFPGYLVSTDYYDKDSVRVLQQKTVAGGLVILYRWQTHESVKTKTYCLAATFVTPAGNGWRAQSSGFIGSENHRCSISDSDGFVAEYTVGGNITDLTTVFGLSNRGSAVRIQWSDGTVSTTTLENGTFLEARPQTLQVRRIQLLDANGNILESKEF